MCFGKYVPEKETPDVSEENSLRIKSRLLDFERAQQYRQEHLDTYSNSSEVTTDVQKKKRKKRNDISSNSSEVVEINKPILNLKSQDGGDRLGSVPIEKKVTSEDSQNTNVINKPRAQSKKITNIKAQPTVSESLDLYKSKSPIIATNPKKLSEKKNKRSEKSNSDHSDSFATEPKIKKKSKNKMKIEKVDSEKSDGKSLKTESELSELFATEIKEKINTVVDTGSVQEKRKEKSLLKKQQILESRKPKKSINSSEPLSYTPNVKDMKPPKNKSINNTKQKQQICLIILPFCKPFEDKSKNISSTYSKDKIIPTIGPSWKRSLEWRDEDFCDSTGYDKNYCSSFCEDTCKSTNSRSSSARFCDCSQSSNYSKCDCDNIPDSRNC